MHAIAKHHFPIDEMASSSKQSEPVIYGPAVKRILYKDDMKSMELHADNHSTKVLDGLNDLRESGLLTDYTLSSDGSSWDVHRAVMVACSDYFRAMLTTDMLESKQKSTDLKGVSAIGLSAIINFAYTGNLTVTEENVEAILSAATHLQVTEAVSLCCTFMKYTISVANCVDFLHLAELYSLDCATRFILGYIRFNFEMVSSGTQYNLLTADQLVTIITSNSVHIASEYKLFQIVLQWVNHDSETREKHMAKLMDKVRLPLLSGEELVEGVSQVDVMQNDVDCCRLLMEAKDYHIVVRKQPMLQTHKTQVRSAKQRLVLVNSESFECFDLHLQYHIFLRDVPIAMYNPCVCVVDNFMYACGGKYDGNDNNDIAIARCFRYDPRFDAWHELPPMDEARKDFVLVGHKNNLFAIAGQDENVMMSSVEMFSIASNDWEIRTPLGMAVYGHAGTLCDNRIYVTGGQSVEGYCDKTMSYSQDTDTWRDEASLLHPRTNHVMATLNGSVYVVGGNVEDSYGFPVPTTSIEMYSQEAHQWTLCKVVLSIREAGACVLDNKLYLIGGINGQHFYSDVIQCYDPDKDEIKVIDMFKARVRGRSCCLLSLPQNVFPHGAEKMEES